MDDYITCMDTSTKAESTKLLIRAVLEQLGLPSENTPIRCTDLACADSTTLHSAPAASHGERSPPERSRTTLKSKKSGSFMLRLSNSQRVAALFLLGM